MSGLYGEMQQTDKAEAGSIAQDELAVGTAMVPVVGHQEKSKGIEEHHNQRQ